MCESCIDELIPLQALSNITTCSSSLICPTKYINSINSSNVYLLLDFGVKALLYFKISFALSGILLLDSYTSLNFNPNFKLLSGDFPSIVDFILLFMLENWKIILRY